MNTSHPLQLAIDRLGLAAMARGLGVSYQAVGKWRAAGRMPRTEWTGETRYCEVIEAMTEGVVTKAALLAAWPELTDTPAAQDAA